MEKGIIVIDEIPQNCRICRLRKINGYCVIAQKDVIYYGLNYNKPEWCPVKKISSNEDNLARSAATNALNGEMDASQATGGLKERLKENGQNTDNSSKVKRCDMCKKESPLADTFVYKGKAYCMNCLYDLLMEMAEDGNVKLTFDNCEENGILAEF